MNEQDRLALIRGRLVRISGPRFKPIGLHRAAHPELPPSKVKKPYVSPPPLPRKSFAKNFEPDLANAHRPDWFNLADAFPEKPRVAPKKRRKGKHYLSEIAEKMPNKLPVLNRPLE